MLASDVQLQRQACMQVHTSVSGVQQESPLPPHLEAQRGNLGATTRTKKKKTV
jgi:hypothetical protein